MAEMRWVRPALVAQVRFVEWTEEGHLRHAAFLGVRSDKAPTRVRRET
jgi:bifunctional non-homologous end joining protein LigD